MSSSFTLSETTTFTLTHARHMAAKVATDLKRLQRLYGSPTDVAIVDYEAEVIELLKAGYLGTLTVGFRRDDWIEPTLKYTARDLAGAAADDDDPGRIRPGANIDGASFYNYLTYSSAQMVPLPGSTSLGRRRLLLVIRTFRVEHAIDQMVDGRLLAPMSSAIGIVGTTRGILLSGREHRSATVP